MHSFSKISSCARGALFEGEAGVNGSLHLLIICNFWKCKCVSVHTHTHTWGGGGRECWLTVESGVWWMWERGFSFVFCYGVWQANVCVCMFLRMSGGGLIGERWRTGRRKAFISLPVSQRQHNKRFKYRRNNSVRLVASVMFLHWCARRISALTRLFYVVACICWAHVCLSLWTPIIFRRALLGITKWCWLYPHHNWRHMI